MGGATSTSPSTSSTLSSTLSTAPSSTPSSTATTSTKTITGAAAQTRCGPVQVQITVTNGKLTAVTAVEYPNNDPRDAQINSYAIPQLNPRALQAGSADINVISGATYTSTGYITSLQSALDQAKA